MDRNQKLHHQHLDAKGVESSALLGWIDASRHPLADVRNGDYTVFEGYETMRLFAIGIRSGWEYHVGHLREDGTIESVEGDDTGRLVSDVDYYVNITEPNARAESLNEARNERNAG